MPGIAGLVSQDSPAVCRSRLHTMVTAMLHDPGYTSATHEEEDLGVYVGCVTRPGTCAAVESGIDPSGHVHLALAGECVQDASEPAGWMLRSYARRAEACVPELNGLFSGLFIDRKRARALLFNDRYGVERLYVHESGGETYFASEAKALLAVLPQTRAFDEEGIAQYLTYGCSVDGATLFAGIRTLDAASIWTFEGGRCRKRQYFVPSEWERQEPLSETAFQTEFEQTFGRAVLRYVRAESQLGISLTGGLDTRMIMACLPALTPAPVCYTFAGLHGHTLDARVAAQVAAACGLEHRLLRIGDDFLSNYGQYVDRTVYVTDGSAGATGAHEIYLNAQAQRLAPVRLTGNFGSEVLRGMSTFKPLGLSAELFAPDFRPHVDHAGRRRPGGTAHPVTFAAFREIPNNLFGTMAAAKSQLTFRTPYLDNDVVALTYRAPAQVRASSSSALRLIARAQPRLGRIATDRAVSADGRGFTYVAKRVFAESTFKLDYLYSEALPTGLLPFDRMIGSLRRVHLLGRHKYLPYRVWFRRQLASHITAVLTDQLTARLPYWDRRVLESFASDHTGGRRNRTREINAILTLAAVERLLLRPQTSVSAGTPQATDGQVLDLVRDSL